MDRTEAQDTMTPRAVVASRLLLRLVVLAGVAVALPALLLGLPLSGGSGGHDSDSTITWLDMFSRAMMQGEAWPRWLPGAAFGFGAPVFYFYPPGAYWLASLVRIVTGLSTDLTLRVVFGLLSLTALLGMWALLRRRAGWAAWPLAGLYACFPYYAFLDQMQRVAYAEYATIAWLPLIGLALETSPARTGRAAVLLAVCYAGLIYVHLPVALLTAGFGGLYYLVRWGTWRALAAFAAGQVLAAMLAAPLLIPALRLQAAISPGYWGFSQAADALLFRHTGSLGTGAKLVLYACFACMAWALVLLWRGWQVRDRPQSAGLLALLACLLSMTPLAFPAWKLLPMLGVVQFPWRAFAPATLFLSLALAARAGAATLGPIRLALVAAPPALATAALFAFVALNPGIGSGGAYRFVASGARVGAAYGNAFTPEYVPATGLASRWMGAVVRGRHFAPPDPLAAFPMLAGGTGSVTDRRDDRADGLEADCPTPCRVLARQFWWPGWRAPGLPPGGHIGLDEATGMIAADLPAGHHRLRFERAALPQQRQGDLVFLAGVLGCALLLLGSALARRRGFRP